jgi:hypothetical protein
MAQTYCTLLLLLGPAVIRRFVKRSKVSLADTVWSAVVQGWEVREQALSLIQQWGLAFQAKQDQLPLFYETYMKLRLKVRR